MKEFSNFVMFARRCKPYLTLRSRLPIGPNGVRLHQFYFFLDFYSKSRYNNCYELAWMAKLANAHGLSPCELWFLRVQVPLYALVILRKMTLKIMQTYMVGQQALAVRKLSNFINLTLW